MNRGKQQVPSPLKSSFDPIAQFAEERKRNTQNMADDADFVTLSSNWLNASIKHRYSYNFNWLGRPIIQYPQDLVALQEIIWETKPDLIVETGIAHGGSLIFHASMLALLGGDGRVVGIDIDIRKHNRKELEAHPLYPRITLLEGSSVDEDIVRKVYEQATGRSSVMVVLDSLHTHDHVLKELLLYSPLVRKGQYLVVLDTVVEKMPSECCSDRPWGVGNNPYTAAKEFLRINDRFVIDSEMNNKLLLSVAPDGYLKCLKD